LVLAKDKVTQRHVACQIHWHFNQCQPTISEARIDKLTDRQCQQHHHQLHVNTSQGVMTFCAPMKYKPMSNSVHNESLCNAR